MVKMTEIRGGFARIREMRFGLSRRFVKIDADFVTEM